MKNIQTKKGGENILRLQTGNATNGSFAVFVRVAKIGNVKTHSSSFFLAYILEIDRLHYRSGSYGESFAYLVPGSRTKSDAIRHHRDLSTIVFFCLIPFRKRPREEKYIPILI